MKSHRLARPGIHRPLANRALDIPPFGITCPSTAPNPKPGVLFLSVLSACPGDPAPACLAVGQNTEAQLSAPESFPTSDHSEHFTWLPDCQGRYQLHSPRLQIQSPESRCGAEIRCVSLSSPGTAIAHQLCKEPVFLPLHRLLLEKSTRNHKLIFKNNNNNNKGSITWNQLTH